MHISHWSRLSLPTTMPVIKAGTIQRSSLHNYPDAFTPTLSEWIAQATAMASSFATPAASSQSSLLDTRDISNVPVTAILSHRQRLVIQSLAAAASTISLFVGLVTVYWFSVMRRSFRHRYPYLRSAEVISITDFARLIFFLVCGDLFRSIWYFVFAWVNLSMGPVETSWKFCQATGFFVQTGNEISGTRIFEDMRATDGIVD